MSSCWTISRRVMLWLTLLASLLASSAMADDFLPPEKAFAFSSKVVGSTTVRLHWDIAPGYHLYRERISVQADAPDVQWQPLNLPPGKDEFDTTFKKTVAVYRQSLDVDVRLTHGNAAIPVTIGWQGCADDGLCYTPDSVQLALALTGFGATQSGITQAPSEGAAQTVSSPSSPT